jgi:hypothetical protein
MMLRFPNSQKLPIGQMKTRSHMGERWRQRHSADFSSPTNIHARGEKASRKARLERRARIARVDAIFAGCYGSPNITPRAA